MNPHQVLAATADVAQCRAERMPITWPRHGGIGLRESPTAVVQLTGLIVRDRSQLDPSDFGPDGRPLFAITESSRLVLRLEALANDASVTSVAIICDSPGGGVLASADICEAVQRLAAVKPVHAFVDGACCSGALWAVCCCQTITASGQSVVGSIGVLQILLDSSAMHESLGLRMVVVASGEFKGVGAAGVPITDSQLEPIREMVYQRAMAFVSAVSAGRKLPLNRVIDLASGRAWLSRDAQRIGLIDAVESLAEFVARLPWKSEAAAKVEEFAHLTGEAALAKFTSLLPGFGNLTTQHEQVAAKYPTLAANARRWQGQQNVARWNAGKL